MAWNEPGGSKDPWSGRGGNQGPPDLDEIVRKLQAKMGSLFGGRGGSSNGSSTGGGGMFPLGAILAVALWSGCWPAASISSTKVSAASN